MTEKQGGSDVRAGTTQATPNGDGSYSLHRPQVVHLGADVRRLPRARPGAGRTVLLLPAADPARRHPQPDVPAAAQGQARQPRQRLQRGRVRRRHRVAGRRGGSRRADHHRDGQPDPAGLHAGQRDQHAHRPDPRHPPRPAPKGVRRVPDRPAADAQRAGRPRRRGRGRHHGGDADGRRHRCRGARRRARDTAAPHRSCRQQVLGVQARHAARRGGDGMPRRQRLRRGIRHAAAVPRGAADGHLGGVRQRQRAGHVACHGNPARMRRGAVRRTRPRPPARTRAWTPTSTRCKPALGDLETIQYRARKVAEDIAWRCRARCWCATAIPPSPRHSWPAGIGGQWGGAFGT